MLYEVVPPVDSSKLEKAVRDVAGHLEMRVDVTEKRSMKRYEFIGQVNCYDYTRLRVGRVFDLVELHVNEQAPVARFETFEGFFARQKKVEQYLNDVAVLLKVEFKPVPERD